ncbi:Two component regulator propeller [Aquiflexum balticum DSM 16537]|uniref:histidine kinase n=1 Tax=Aquiflexum balticum DSM 16537 TaxID=758820 RepID=A0A1W2H1H7_9BACT|nr:sensor histidine kinase [Aquiflexum balticum]SMD42817.1 Two component regulator propeller [Aquiflexum balticum DSM 16537]
MIKNTLFIALIASALSCTKAPETENEPISEKQLGITFKDSFPEPEIVQFKLGPKIPKEAYIASQRKFSLEAEYGKEAVSSITPKDGLPPEGYPQLGFDKKGNVWINTSTSLQYDGSRFKEFDVIGTDLTTRSILIDKNDHLWIHGFKTANDSIEDRIMIFDGIRCKDVAGLKVKTKVSKTSLGLGMFAGADKSIWVINSLERKIMKYVGEEVVESFEYGDLSINDEASLQDLGDEGLFIFDYYNAILTRIKAGYFETTELKTILPETRILAINVTDSNTFYASTTSGTYRIDNKKATSLNKDSRGLFIDKNNFVWNITDKGIKKSKGTLTLEFENSSLFNNSIGLTLKSDNNDHTWIAVKSLIGRFDETIKTYNNLFDGGDNTSRIINLYQARNSDIYLGTLTKGLIHFDGTTITQYDFLKKQTKDSRENRILSIAEDPEGNIWFTQFGGRLTKFDAEFFQSYDLDAFLSKIYHVDSAGTFWLDIWDQDFKKGGLYKFDGKDFLKVTTPSKIGLRATSVCTDTSGAAWIGTGEALWKFDKGIFTKYTTQDGLPNDFINTVQSDAKGNIWIGTDNGLSIFDGKKFRNYGRPEGIVEKIIGSIIPDSTNNKFWIKGQFSDYLIAASYNDQTKELQVETFSANQGFPIPSYNAFLVDQQGLIWMSTNSGDLARFDYQTLKKNSNPFPIHLNTILVNGESLVWSELNENYSEDSLISKTEMISRFGKEKSTEEIEALKETFSSISYDSLIPFDFIPIGLELPFSANSLSFEFTAIDPFFSKSTLYQYYLDGFDKAWSPLSKNNTANFGNLMEGSYTFQLKALNPYGIWSEMSYSFRVLPPWYRTWWAYLLYAFLFFGAITGFIRWRTNKLKTEKALLEQEVSHRTSELKESLEHLKSTQAQLIQSEKMASLGELTAGIAHEIQNPLNFVNNFSEVSAELLDEVKETRTKSQETRPRTEEDEIEDEILEDIKKNLEKINHHGKRADAIVKGMLEHSRTSTGEKAPTDLNALADEYVRLSYHGFRAKDKSFNTDYKLDLDPNLPKVNVVASDIGRVILNLVNNAFYACAERGRSTVNEKSKSGPDSHRGEGYKPEVIVSSSKTENGIEISVKDNGNGIPDSIKEKIFQPFFTTKPTGSGTGLGLSLSYDIIKAHGGELRVVSEEGKGTEMKIILLIIKDS